MGSGQRIENRAAGIPTYLERATRQAEAAEQIIRDTDERIGARFRHADTLQRAQARLAEITRQLEALHAATDPETTGPPTADSGPSSRADGQRPQPAPVAAFGHRGDAGSQSPTVTP